MMPPIEDSPAALLPPAPFAPGHGEWRTEADPHVRDGATAAVRVQNLCDVLDARAGRLPPGGVRTVEVEARVDSSAAFLGLPPAAIKALGLISTGTKRVRTSAGLVERRFFTGAEATILDRSATLPVEETGESESPWAGPLLLGALGLVIDPGSSLPSAVPERGLLPGPGSFQATRQGEEPQTS